MLRFNKNTRTLEQDEYRYELQNVSDPNLYRDIYSYGEVPKVSFNHRFVPMVPAEEIWITDTTFRDGQQSLPPFTVKQVVDLYDMLHKLGGSNGMIKQSEFFLYSEKDKEAVFKCLEKGYKYPEITGWIRANKKDFKLVKEMGLKETGILTSASDYHIFLKLKLNRKQAMEQYLDIVRSSLEEGIIPRCHFEDITRADFYGFVVPFAQELMKLARDAKMPVKIRACDTMGYGITYRGSSLPRSVPGIIYGLTKLANVPSEWLEWHGHNDFYKSLNNSATAWLFGCSSANGTLLGIGERTGNTPLEGLVVEYIALRGHENGMDTTVITDIARYFEKEIGYKIYPKQPLVGADFNVTKAGIHADGMLKDEEIYNIFDTKKILNKNITVGITDKSGVAGIVLWLNSYLKFEGDKRIDKGDSRILEMRKWVDEQYDSGRCTEISSIEMAQLTKEYFPEYFKDEEPVI